LLYEYAFDPEQESAILAGDVCELVRSEPFAANERIKVTVHNVDLGAGLWS
jgi:hypothetical protein